MPLPVMVHKGISKSELIEQFVLRQELLGDAATDSMAVAPNRNPSPVHVQDEECSQNAIAPQADLEIACWLIGGGEVGAVMRSMDWYTTPLGAMETWSHLRTMKAGMQANYGPTDLAQLTAELSSVFRSAIEKAGLRFTIDCPPLPELIYVDREMWEKIVLNLVSNAFKFTFEGEITVTLRSKLNHVELIVKDTGIGIPETELKRLFEGFYRVEGSRGRTYEGSGMGLCLVQELVQLHGGAIYVESNVKGGATFTVTIPMLSQSVQEKAQSCLDLSPIRVLVVDDDPDSRDIVAFLLNEFQAVVTAVGNGIEALNVFCEFVPDLLIGDMGMPEMDGYTLMRQIRQLPPEQGGQIPAIALTAKASESDRLQSIQAGYQAHLAKPINPDELIQIVTRLVNIKLL